MKRRLCLYHDRCPGDILVMTACVRDLALNYPDDFEIIVDTKHKDIWANNPHVLVSGPGVDKKSAKFVKLSYGNDIRHAHAKALHFMYAFHRDLKKKTGIFVPMGLPYPDLHLTEEEKTKRRVPGRYWVVFSGGKTDFTTKHPRFKHVVDACRMLQAMGITIVQAGRKDYAKNDVHPVIPGVVDMIDHTSPRQLMSLIAQADGVMCTITYPMHLAAALGRPCVVWAGGREAWWWEGYHRHNPGLGPRAGELPVNHRYLHTLGLLDCCRDRGCWKSKVDPASKDKSRCSKPVHTPEGQIVPLCQDMIAPERVVEAVLSYYHDGTLPPLEPAVSASIDRPTTLTLPDGRRAVITLQIVGDDPAPPAYAPPATEEFTKSQPALLPPAPVPRPAPSPPSRTAAPDDPLIGGKATICVLCSGPRRDGQRRSLDAVLKTVPSTRLNLRVFCNAAAPDTVEYVRDLESRNCVEKAYYNDERVGKYTAMRQMLHDDAKPVTTTWLIWLDDDAYCDINPAWFSHLCSEIGRSMRVNSAIACLGPRRFQVLNTVQLDWLRKGAWHRGKPFRDKTGQGRASGNKVHYADGACMALRMDAVRFCQIPDVRLGQAGGDVCIGEQFWQNGYEVKDWNQSKKIVLWSIAPRRGYTGPMFG